MTSAIMDFTGERYVPQLKGPIYYEHAHRYAMAVPLVGGKDVLDIASGEGYGTVLLARHARSVTGVDIDSEAVAHSRRAYDVPNAHFRVGSCEAIPMADGSVDVTVSFETLEHLTEHESFIGEVRRVLRRGGIFLVSSPNKREYSDVPNFQNPYHLRELYFSEFRDFLTRSFKHVAIFGQRLSAISLIYSLGSSNDSSTWLNASDQDVKSGLPLLEHPLYFIAACSDEPLPEAITTSAFIDPHDDLLSHYGPTPAPPIAQPEALAAPVRVLALPHGHSPTVSPGRVGALEERDAEIRRLRDQVAERDDLSARAHGRIAELEAQIAGLESRLVARDAEVTAVAAQVAQVTQSAEEAGAAYEERLAAAVAARAEAEARLERVTEASELEKVANFRVLAEVRRLEGELRRARAELAEAEERSTEQHAQDQRWLEEAEQRAARERDSYEAQHAEGQRQLDEMRALLHGVLTSRSWTLTKPIRVAMRTLRRDSAQ